MHPNYVVVEIVIMKYAKRIIWPVYVYDNILFCSGSIRKFICARNYVKETIRCDMKNSCIPLQWKRNNQLHSIATRFSHKSIIII